MSKRSGVPNGAEKVAKEVVQEPSELHDGQRQGHRKLVLIRSLAVDKQERLLNDPNPGHFSLVRAYHLADLITLMNGFCGVMSIMSSMRYCMSPPNQKGDLYAALVLMPLGLFFDFFDGKVARWRQKSSLMGQELDSLADLVCCTVTQS